MGFSLRYVVLVTPLLLFVGCSSDPASAPKPVFTADANPITRGNLQFAIELHQQLATAQGNLIFSPFSIRSALAMTASGAEGATNREILRTIHLPEGDVVQEAVGALVRWLNWSGERATFQLRIVNTLWGQKGIDWKEDFLNRLKDDYAASLQEIDFDQSQAARQTINCWVREKTNDKIQELIPSGMITPETLMALTNTVDFLGDWEEAFEPSVTEQLPFFRTPDDAVPTAMMQQTAEFAYHGDSKVQVLQMSYSGNELSMLIVLPNEKNGLAKLEEELTAEQLQRWLKQLSPREVIVSLPKFTMTQQFNLTDALRAMGMPRPFSDQANFTGMANDNALLLDFVVHKAYIVVNERGTEAAAASAEGLDKGSEPEASPPVFRADHPFLFLIRDTRHELILLMGRLTDPRP